MDEKTANRLVWLFVIFVPFQYYFASSAVPGIAPGAVIIDSVWTFMSAFAPEVLLLAVPLAAAIFKRNWLRCLCGIMMIVMVAIWIVVLIQAVAAVGYAMYGHSVLGTGFDYTIAILFGVMALFFGSISGYYLRFFLLNPVVKALFSKPAAPVAAKSSGVKG